MKTFKIVKNYKIYFGISALIILAGFLMMITQGLNFGIDFTGGTMMQIEMGETTSVSELQDVLAPFDLSPEIVHAGLEKTGVIIKTKVSLNNDDRKAIFAAIQDA